MAKLDHETIHQLTTLSRIHAKKEEEEELLSDLQKILSYIDQLNEIDTKDVLPCNQVVASDANVFREDQVGDCLPRELFLENAPSQIGGLIRVPLVIKQS